MGRLFFSQASCPPTTPPPPHLPPRVLHPPPAAGNLLQTLEDAVRIAREIPPPHLDFLHLRRRRRRGRRRLCLRFRSGKSSPKDPVPWRSVGPYRVNLLLLLSTTCTTTRTAATISTTFSYIEGLGHKVNSILFPPGFECRPHAMGKDCYILFGRGGGGSGWSIWHWCLSTCHPTTRFAPDC